MPILITLGAIATALLIAAYWKDKTILTIAADMLWLLFALQSYSLSTQNWLNWDIYMGMFFFGIMLMLATVIESLWQKVNHPDAQKALDESLKNTPEGNGKKVHTVNYTRAKHGLPPRKPNY